MLLASEEWAAKRNLPSLAYLRYGKAWAVDFASGKEGLLMAPAYAVSAMLKDAGLTLQDFDYYEIHEAFAAQVLCTLKAWESPEYCRDVLGCRAPLGSIDRAKLNVKGGSIAIGHPFAATGARIVARLAKLLANDRQAQTRTHLRVHGRRHGSHRHRRALASWTRDACAWASVLARSWKDDVPEQTVTLRSDLRIGACRTAAIPAASMRTSSRPSPPKWNGSRFPAAARSSTRAKPPMRCTWC